MMKVDDGGGRGVKNDRKCDDVINGQPISELTSKRVFTLNIDQSFKTSVAFNSCNLTEFLWKFWSF